MDAIGRASEAPTSPRSTRPLASESIALIGPLAGKARKEHPTHWDLL